MSRTPPLKRARPNGRRQLPVPSSHSVYANRTTPLPPPLEVPGSAVPGSAGSNGSPSTPPPDRGKSRTEVLSPSMRSSNPTEHDDDYITYHFGTGPLGTNVGPRREIARPRERYLRKEQQDFRQLQDEVFSLRLANRTLLEALRSGGVAIPDLGISLASGELEQDAGQLVAQLRDQLAAKTAESDSIRARLDSLESDHRRDSEFADGDAEMVANLRAELDEMARNARMEREGRDAEMDRLNKELQRTRTAVRAAETRATLSERDLKVAQDALSALEKETKTSQPSARNSEAEKELEEKLEKSQARVVELEAKLVSVQNANSEQLEALRAQSADKVQEDTAVLEAQLQTTKTDLETTRDNVVALESQLRSTKTELMSARDDMDTLRSSLESVRNQLAGQRETSERLRERLRGLEAHVAATAQTTSFDDTTSFDRTDSSLPKLYEDVSREAGLLDRDNADLRRDNGYLSDRCTEMAAALEQAEAAAAEAIAAQERAEAEAAGAKEAAKNATSAAESSSSSAASATEAARQATARAEKAEADAKDARAVAEHAVAEQTRLEGVVSKLKSSLQAAETRVEELKQELSSTKDALESTKRKLADKHHEAADLEERITRMKEELAAMGVEARNTKADSDRAVRELTAKLNAAHKELGLRTSKIKELEAQTESLNAQVESDRKLIAQMGDQIKQEQAAVKLARDTGAEQTSKLTAELQKTRQERAALDLEAGSLRKTVDNLEKTNTTLSESIQQKNERVHEVESATATLQLELQRLRNAEPQVAAYEDALKRAREAEEARTVAERAKSEAVSKLNECYAEANRYVAGLEAQLAAQTDKVERLETEQQQRFRAHQLDVEMGVREALAEKDRKLADVQNELEAAKRTIERDRQRFDQVGEGVRADYNEVVVQKNKVEAELAAQKDRADRLTQQRNEALSTVSELKAQIAQLEVANRDAAILRNQLDELKTNAESAASVNASANAELVQANAEAESRIRALRIELEQVTFQSQQLSAKLETSQSQASELRNKLEQIMQLKTQLSDLTTRFRELGAAYERSQVRIRDLIAIKNLNDRLQRDHTEFLNAFNRDRGFKPLRMRPTLRGAIAKVQAALRFKKLLEEIQHRS